MGPNLTASAVACECGNGVLFILQEGRAKDAERRQVHLAKENSSDFADLHQRCSVLSLPIEAALWRREQVADKEGQSK